VPRLLAALLAVCAGASALAQDRPVPAPFIRTPDEVVERMLALAGAGAGDVVFDLGSGDGRIVIAAARRRGSRGVGIERDASLVALAERNAAAAGVADRVRFVHDDVLTAELAPASVVTVYLLPDLMWQLRSRFIYELQPGTRIVSHEFGLPGWPPDRVETFPVGERLPGQGGQSTLYLWVVPANVRGEWRGGDERLRIAQSYQQIEIEGATHAKLRGREISWESPRGRFAGRVAGDRIVGRFEGTAGPRAATFARVR
jgi:SAM-dependent methyltransferase